MDEALPTIQARLTSVRARIEAAVQRAGRPPGSVRLLAVSKTKSEAAIREAYAAGQRDFGENYVQELCAKAEALSDLADLRFHVIGPLQRNKVKQVVPVASLVHTVDRASLAEEIEKRAAAAGRTVPVLLEVNVSGEASKAGCSSEEAPSLAALVRSMPHLELRGLMTIPPDTDDREEARPFFAKLRELRDRIGELPELSMGMSHDFEIAIEEGATIVRVGTAIFGAR
ncbi:MAG: YggS family pyridoxal phosphate-dependent enzyme [Polyangiaceae bacterium]